MNINHSFDIANSVRPFFSWSMHQRVKLTDSDGACAEYFEAKLSVKLNMSLCCYVFSLYCLKFFLVFFIFFRCASASSNTGSKPDVIEKMLQDKVQWLDCGLIR
jgi:hypothetical protein